MRITFGRFFIAVALLTACSIYRLPRINGEEKAKRDIERLASGQPADEDFWMEMAFGRFEEHAVEHRHLFDAFPKMPCVIEILAYLPKEDRRRGLAAICSSATFDEIIERGDSIKSALLDSPDGDRLKLLEDLMLPKGKKNLGKHTESILREGHGSIERVALRGGH